MIQYVSKSLNQSSYMVSSSIARCHSTIAGTGLLSYIRSFSEDYYFWPWCNPRILSWSGYRYLLPL